MFRVTCVRVRPWARSQIQLRRRKIKYPFHCKIDMRRDVHGLEGHEERGARDRTDK